MSATCSIRIARTATLHHSRTALNLAGSSGITTFDAPNAATGSTCASDAFTDCGTNVGAISNAGTVTGFYLDSNLEMIGYIRSPGGQFTSFEAPGVTVPGGGTDPLTISETGVIGGGFLEANLVVNDGWIRETDGTFLNADAPFASTDPTLPNGSGSYVRSINVRGETGGVWFDAQGKQHAFIRSADGLFVKVIPPNAVQNDICPVGCLNAAGTAMGAFGTGPGNPEFAYIRTAAGSFTVFGAPGAPFTNSSGITAGGEAAGYYFDSSFLEWGYTRDIQGTFAGFQAPDASNGTQVDAINDAGAVTGIYVDSSGTVHGFYRSPSGEFAEFDPTGSVFTLPIAINGLGQVAGEWFDAQGQIHGFLWRPH